MKISDLDQPRIGDIVEFETDPETVVEGLIVGETEDGYIYEFSDTGYTELHEACTYGKYYCSTDKKYKCRTGPKQSRTTEAANAAQQAAIAIAKKKKLKEFAPDGGSGGEEDTLYKYARMWYNGDLHTQQQVEQVLDRMGWEIGEIESEEGGAFVVRSGDENGNSYIGFAPADLTEGVAEGEVVRHTNRHGTSQVGIFSPNPREAKQALSRLNSLLKVRLFPEGDRMVDLGLVVQDEKLFRLIGYAEENFPERTDLRDFTPFRQRINKLIAMAQQKLTQGVAEEKQRLDPKCWDGYKKDGTKMKGGVRVNNCVKEASGYIPRNSQEAQDPRWSSALTGDVTTSTMRDQIGKFFPTTAPKDGQEQIHEAEYQGREVPLGRPMRGDVKKFKVYVKDPSTGNVKKVNFGDPNMRIKKSNPKRRKSFRARHNCANPGPRTKARYWSCRKW